MCYVLQAVAYAVVQLSCGAVTTGAAVELCLGLPRMVSPCSVVQIFLYMSADSSVFVAVERQHLQLVSVLHCV